MRVIRSFSLVLILIATLLSLALPASAKTPVPHQTYTVMVGLEYPNKGIGINAYFPETITIHEGDTVHWVQNSNEIHTVTFGTDGKFPPIVPLIVTATVADPSPLIFNPVAVNLELPVDGVYNGTPANSGLMGREEGELKDFDLTFSENGTYKYLCLVHGSIMSGKVVVEKSDIIVPSPNQAMAQGKKEMAQKRSQAAELARDAMAMADDQVPLINGDGTVTHNVMVGYADGQIDLMKFFPDKLIVRPGDTVVWKLGAKNEAPHTVTFLNGDPAPSLVIPVEQLSGPPLLYLNPEVLFLQSSGDLSRIGTYNSGILNPPPIGPTNYTLVIDDNIGPGLESYVCLLHDESGMTGKLMIVPNR